MCGELSSLVHLFNRDGVRSPGAEAPSVGALFHGLKAVASTVVPHARDEMLKAVASTVVPHARDEMLKAVASTVVPHARDEMLKAVASTVVPHARDEMRIGGLALVGSTRIFRGAAGLG
jgi:hypothetical protein